MSCFVNGDGAALLLRGYLRFLLQSAHDAVNGIEEVLLVHLLLSMACGDESSFVADVGNVGARETWRLASQQIDIDRIVKLQGAQVYAKYLLALIEVGQIHMDLPVKAPGTQQRLVEHIHAIGGCQDDDTAV